MKILLLRGILTIALGILPLFAVGAGVSDTNEVASTNNDVLVLMKFSRTDVDGASKKLPAVIVTVTNNSTNEVTLGWPTVGPPVWFKVTLPSDKDLTTPEPGARLGGSTITRPILRAHEASEFVVRLNYICPVKEAGTYRYTAKVRIFYANSNSVVTSSRVAVLLSDADIKALESSGNW